MVVGQSDQSPSAQGHDSRGWWARTIADPTTLFSGITVLITLVLAGISFYQARLSSLVARRQLRAYVSAVKSTLKFETVQGRPCALITVRIENCGQTPARKVKIWILSKLSAIPPSDIPDMDDGVGADIGAGGGFSATAMELIDTPEGDAFLAKDLDVWVTGLAIYEDIFGEEHSTRFCLKYIAGLGFGNFGPDNWST